MTMLIYDSQPVGVRILGKTNIGVMFFYLIAKAGQVLGRRLGG